MLVAGFVIELSSKLLYLSVINLRPELRDKVRGDEELLAVLHSWMLWWGEVGSKLEVSLK